MLDCWNPLQFCYLLRKDKSRNDPNYGDFDVSNFTKRMSKATGLNIEEIKSDPNEIAQSQRKFSIRQKKIG